MLSNVRGQLTKLWTQSTVQLPPEVKVQLEVTYTETRKSSNDSPTTNDDIRDATIIIMPVLYYKLTDRFGLGHM